MGKKSTTEDIVDKIKASRQTIEDTYKIQKQRPDLLELILARQLTVDQAKEMIRKSCEKLSIPSDDIESAAQQILEYIENGVISREFARGLCKRVLLAIND